jgi:hypothetical protein
VTETEGNEDKREEKVEEKRKESEAGGASSNGSRKKAVIVVAIACIVVVAAVAALNGQGLSVSSDVEAVAEQEEAEVAPAVTNSPPEIVGLTASTDRIEPFDICDITCDAVDPDGDQLTYTWTATHGDIYGEGPTIEWGSPIEEGLYRVSVSVDDGHGGVTEFSTSLRVMANTAPAILSMSTDVNWVAPGSPLYFSCVAQDVDGDEIAYEWVVTGGEVYGTGTSIVWLAPETEGSYWITVYARDAYGGESLRALPISVTKGEPPTIGEFVIEGVNTELVKPSGDAWKVFRGRTLTIECVVEDGAGPFKYKWSADRGNLSEDGKTATWEAPDTRVSATVIVDVTDAHGNTASKSVLIYVETCTCAFG